MEKENVIYTKPRIVPDALKHALPFATMTEKDDLEISASLEKMAIDVKQSIANAYVPKTQLSNFSLYRGKKGYGIVRDVNADSETTRRALRTFFIFKLKYTMRDTQTKESVAMCNALKHLIVECNKLAKEKRRQFEIINLKSKIVYRSRPKLPVFDASLVAKVEAELMQKNIETA